MRAEREPEVEATPRKGGPEPNVLLQGERIVNMPPHGGKHKLGPLTGPLRKDILSTWQGPAPWDPGGPGEYIAEPKGLSEVMNIASCISSHNKTDHGHRRLLTRDLPALDELEGGTTCQRSTPHMFPIHRYANPRSRAFVIEEPTHFLWRPVQRALHWCVQGETRLVARVVKAITLPLAPFPMFTSSSCIQ